MRKKISEQIDDKTAMNRVFYERRNLENLFKAYPSLPAYIKKCMSTFPDLPAITDPHNGIELTYGELEAGMAETASGLQALGVKKGDFVAIFSENCGLWCMADQGIMRAGGITTPRGTAAPATELQYILEHSEAKYLILQNEAILDKIFNILETHPLTAIIMLHQNGEMAKKGLKTPTYTLEELREIGRKHKFIEPDLCMDDISTMLYTSGTTGNPKGVLLTHMNVCSQFPSVDEQFQAKPGEKTLQILPIWHSYERTAQTYNLLKCCHLHFTTIPSLGKDLLSVRPATLMSVPKIWDTIEQRLIATLKKKSAIAYGLFIFATTISKQYVYHRIYSHRTIPGGFALWKGIKKCAHKAVQCLLAPGHFFFLKTLYPKIKTAAGLNFRGSISGGGSLPMHTQLFYEGMGVTLLEGYGMTESAPVLTLRFIEEENYLGSTGKPIKGTEIKIVDPKTREKLPRFKKGLIMARGPQVMKGYYKDEAETQKMLDKDGWLNTGDLGWLTDTNHLVIVGREKDTIVLSNGENIEPLPIEDALLESPMISQIVLVGQDEDNLGALIVPSEEALKAANTEPDKLTVRIRTLQNKELRDLIKKEIQTHIKNKGNLKSFEYIHQFAVLKDKFTLDNGTMSASGKIKRKKVIEQNKDIIKEMYKKK